MLKRKNRIIGVTLIELLLSLTLSCIILSGMMEIYLITQKNYATLTAFKTIQDNSNIAIQVLSQSIREAAPLASFDMKNNRITLINQSQEKTYFIDKKSLFLKEKNSNKIELIDGIESMKIMYDVLLNEEVIERSAEKIEQNAKIVGVSITLMMSNKKEYLYVALREI